MEYQGTLEALMAAIHSQSNGALHCLPHVRVLLDFFEKRGMPAYPLVVRCVVFGTTSVCAPDPLMMELAEKVIASPSANGVLQGPEGAIGFRTIGYGHGICEEGTYSRKAGWTGHLVVVVGTIMIDPTLGQINRPNFGINIDPPYGSISADSDFLSGRAPMAVRIGGHFVHYRAFPEEHSYTPTQSWSDAAFRKRLLGVAEKMAARFKGQSDLALHSPLPKIAKNAPCYCGSRKKYKACCGR